MKQTWLNPRCLCHPEASRTFGPALRAWRKVMRVPRKQANKKPFESCKKHMNIISRILRSSQWQWLLDCVWSHLKHPWWFLPQLVMGAEKDTFMVGWHQQPMRQQPLRKSSVCRMNKRCLKGQNPGAFGPGVGMALGGCFSLDPAQAEKALVYCSDNGITEKPFRQYRCTWECFVCLGGSWKGWSTTSLGCSEDCWAGRSDARRTSTCSGRIEWIGDRGQKTDASLVPFSPAGLKIHLF